MFEELLQYIAWAAVGLIGYLLKTIWSRLDAQKQQLDELSITLAKNGEQNKELYNNISRLDKNIDLLFDKIDELLDETRSANK